MISRAAASAARAGGGLAKLESVTRSLVETGTATMTFEGRGRETYARVRVVAEVARANQWDVDVRETADGVRVVID